MHPGMGTILQMGFHLADCAAHFVPGGLAEKPGALSLRETLSAEAALADPVSQRFP